MELSDMQVRGDQELVVSEMSLRSVTPNDRKHKYEEEIDLTRDGATPRAAKCSRSNSLGSYFVPIVPSIESSVRESQLQFGELEIVDTVDSSCEQPESVFHFIPVIDSNNTNKSSTLQDESRVGLYSDSKCTSNFASEHVLSCSLPSCGDLNSDPRFFQSQSAPALLLTDESENILHTTTLTINAPNFPATHEATEATSPVKVTSTLDSEYTLFDVSSAEKRRRLNPSIAGDDVNAEEFDNYTTGESSLCDSSRRSLAPSRSAPRYNYSSHSYDHYDTRRRSSKVSSISGDVYTDHSVRTLASSSRHYRGRSHSRSTNDHNTRGKSNSSGSRSRSSNRSSGRSSSRSSSKCTVSTYSRHTTHTSYSYTTHHTYSRSYRHDRVDRRYSEYTETTHSVSTPSTSSRQDRDNRDYCGKVSSGCNSDNYSSRGASSGCYSDTRSPSPVRTVHESQSSDTQKNSASPDVHSTSLTVSSASVKDPDNYRYYRDLSYRDLPLEWWERTDHCKEAKLRHTDRIDHMCGSRESLVLKTTLWKEDIVLEPNMFPYYTPYGVEHYTLWSVEDMTHEQIVSFVDRWLYRRMPHVRRWQYDDNSGERSIDLFHVHVFIETAPFQYAPREGMLYIPPHAMPPVVTGESDRHDTEDAVVV